MTSGLDSATASATAREPSTCLSTGGLRDLQSHELEGAFGTCYVTFGELPRESVTYGSNHRGERDHPGEGGKAAEQYSVRDWPTHCLSSDLRRRHRHRARGSKRRRQIADTQLGEAAAGIDEQVALFRQTAEEVDLVEQGRVLDDQGVRARNRLVCPDLVVRDAAVRDHGCPCP